MLSGLEYFRNGIISVSFQMLGILMCSKQWLTTSVSIWTVKWAKMLYVKVRCIVWTYSK